MRKAPGFTLVELVICVGVIGLVAAMLMPAFVKARQQARLVTCASNIHQIAAAVQMYADDNKGWLAGADATDFWWRYVTGCQHGNSPGTYPAYLPYDFNTTSGTVWTCPFVAIDLESRVRYPSSAPDNWSNHFGLNRNLQLKPFKIVSLRSDVGFLADGMPITSSTPGSPTYPFRFDGNLNSTWTSPFGQVLRYAPWPIDRTGATTGRASIFHAGVFSMAYLDGHVTTQSTITIAALAP